MNVLDQILAAKQEEVDHLRPLAVALQRQVDQALPVRPFAAALRAGKHIALIAEFKRRSPSAGWIRQDGSVAEITKAYSDCGARAISVLTDEKFFGGTLSDLRAARETSEVPILRKDFVLEEIQLLEARAAGADAVLLIVRALDDTALKNLLTIACGIGLDVLVETHNEKEIERALKAGADVIGVNNRDLSTFHVDLDLTARMLDVIPNNIVVVAESGIHNAEEVAALGQCGVDAVLVGETLMRADDICAAVKSFSEKPKFPR